MQIIRKQGHILKPKMRLKIFSFRLIQSVELSEKVG